MQLIVKGGIMIHAGLRVDVDTLRGTCIGVPNLLDLLERHQVRASLFFSVGPDNMGRHLWRLIRPGFLLKMLRTRAPSLYGWDILLKGTFWPGPLIGKHSPGPIRAAAEKGHEIGLHAWDHQEWQTRLEKMDDKAILERIQKGYDTINAILGKPPECFAAPGWRMTGKALSVLERYPFRYQSDFRGHSIFRPVINRRKYIRVQVPVTLPTYDEMICAGFSPAEYNDVLLDMIQPERLNILTIHAEVEGISCLHMFEEFLEKAAARDIRFQSLGSILSSAVAPLESEVHPSSVAGREGWVACQKSNNEHE